MLSQELITPIVYHTTKIFLIILGTWIAQKILISFLKQLRKKFKKSQFETLAQKQQRVKTLTNLLINTTKVITNLAAFLLILTELGINILPLITGVGILGLGVGMGAKTMISDLIAGFFILLEDQFNVGDWIKINSTEGEVTKINLRTITLKDKQGNIYLVPNSTIKIVKKVKLH